MDCSISSFLSFFLFNLVVFSVAGCLLFDVMNFFDFVEIVTILTSVSDQGEISLYNINTITRRQVSRIKEKILTRELLVDLISNSPN